MAELEAANEKLSERLAKQSEELRQLSKRLADLDILVQQHDSALPQIRDDLRSRIKEMIAQESDGRRRRRRRPPPRNEPKFEVKPFMGFDAQDILPDVAEHLELKAEKGVLVTDVRPDSPAAAAGLEKYDVIQQFDGQAIGDFKDLKKAFADKKPGETVSVTVLRGEKKVELKVKIGAKKVRVG